MSDTPVLTIHTDGASRGNPGASAFSYVIARKGAPVVENAGCLGDMTNNQAEYTALVRALEHALKLGPAHRVVLNSDSELMVKQLKGEYKVKNADLRPLFERARELAGRFAGGVEFVHVRRELNKRADQLCNNALDGKRSRKDDTEEEEELGLSLRDEVVACLELAGVETDAGVVWHRIATILKRHGVELPDR
jgi:ribonuclease HI/probable phosphoglycerate mutase